MKKKLPKDPNGFRKPPFETRELRTSLASFFSTGYDDPVSGQVRRIGGVRWGVYAFFDYDNEPIYVGQSYESLGQRISRHLTNQRTDAVAMSVLDPFEVCDIALYPLPQFEHVTKRNHPEFKGAKAYLDALEYAVTHACVRESRFRAILNEKDPPNPTVEVGIPAAIRGRVVSDATLTLRAHPDVRIARRSLTMARLAQTISERKVKVGLRRVLFTQARRLQWLSEQQFQLHGGEASVEVGVEEPSEVGLNERA